MTDIRADCVVVGGGIAGLWLLNVLQARGLQTVLVERTALGAAQTLASQGLIHGGMKYALDATWNRSAEAIAAMPARWREHLRGAATPDLRGTTVLSEQFQLWSNARLSARLRALLASRAVRGDVTRLDPTATSSIFRHPAFDGDLYQLSDFVVDSQSLLQTLADAWRDHLLLGEVRAIDRSSTTTHRLLVDVGDTQLQIDCARVLLCAGDGNSKLGAAASGPIAASSATIGQRRPLHQVFVTADHLPDVFAHCIAGDARTEPRLTITTHASGTHRVWAIGGALATSGVVRTREQQIAMAQHELAQCLPWLPLTNAHYATLRIDRAEPATLLGARPDSAFVTDHDGVLLCWPTKLTLTPDLADRVSALLDAEHVEPRADTDLTPLRTLPHPSVAAAPWEHLAWS